MSANMTDCGAKNEVSQTEPIRCKECGHRVLYKPRTHRSELLLLASFDAYDPLSRNISADDTVVSLLPFLPLAR